MECNINVIPFYKEYFKSINLASVAFWGLFAVEFYLKERWKVKMIGMETEELDSITRKKCAANNCDQFARTVGMCPRHYQQMRRYGRLTPELEYQSRGDRCAAKGCEELPVARGHCARHYQQIRRYGRLTPERERNFNPKPSCMFPGCDAKHAARGYCKKHYMSEYYFNIQLKECAG
jgi:hypothetical protein